MLQQTIYVALISKTPFCFSIGYASQVTNFSGKNASLIDLLIANHPRLIDHCWRHCKVRNQTSSENKMQPNICTMGPLCGNFQAREKVAPF